MASKSTGSSNPGKRGISSTPMPGGKAGLAEVGRSGLLISNGIVFEEFLVQLRGWQGRKIFREMADNDPIIGGFLLAYGQTLARLKWHVQEADDASDQDKAAAEFVQEAFEDMSDDWSTTLSGIMSMCPYGWSFHEIVYKRRRGASDQPGKNSKFSDGRIGWRKWAPRAQESLMHWLMDDNGGIQGMHQQTLTGMYDIPIEKALLFRVESAKNNPEGRSLIRNCYRPWYFKKRIEEIEAIGVERDLAGLPMVTMDPKYFSPNASPDEVNVRNQMVQLVQNVKRNETEGILMPVEYDAQGNKLVSFELLSTGGVRNFDTDKIIGRYNQQIAMAVLADFLMLGHENVGSQSLGVSKIELWMMAVEAMAKSIASVVNQHAIPRLLKLNGISCENPPELVYGQVEQVDLIAMGTFLKNATDSGLLIPDEGLEEHIRELADLPPIDKEEREDIYGVDGFIYGPRPVPPELQAAQDQAALAAAQGIDQAGTPGTPGQPATLAGATPPAPGGKPAPGTPAKPAPAGAGNPSTAQTVPQKGTPPAKALPKAPAGDGLPKVPGADPTKKTPNAKPKP